MNGRASGGRVISSHNDLSTASTVSVKRRNAQHCRSSSITSATCLNMEVGTVVSPGPFGATRRAISSLSAYDGNPAEPSLDRGMKVKIQRGHRAPTPWVSPRALLLNGKAESASVAVHRYSYGEIATSDLA